MLFPQIVPPDVMTVETHADLSHTPLFPEEARVIRNAQPKRHREFATVRACARDALRSLGLGETAVIPGLGGAPQWPAEVVGSMTHSAGFCAAAVSKDTTLAGLGIDAEPNDNLPVGVLEAIASTAEIAMVRRWQLTNADVAWDRLLFCAKEAAYKAWFPSHQRVLTHENARVTLDLGTFTAVLNDPATAATCEIAGQWIATQAFICAAATLAHPAPHVHFTQHHNERSNAHV